MTWRIATRHVSTYRYAEPVVASYNEVRMTPLSFGGQALLESHLDVRPKTPLFRYRDYWSTTVHAFDVHEPHDELVVTGSSVTETGRAPDDEEGCSWDELRRSEVEDRYVELLGPTRYAPSDPELAELATMVAGSSSPLGAVRAVCGWVRDEMRYEPGTTKVSTSATEAWHQKSGVCQDFAHLTTVMLRHLRIPARYVSGYLHPRAEATIGETVAGASHAWVEAWVGRWVALDPTNESPVGERHVTVGRGRDYHDVAPLRGIHHGGRLAALEVSVELTRIA